MPEVRQALWNRGYILVIIIVDTTGSVQVNNTHLHELLQSKYQKRESELMPGKLQNDPEKIPAPDQNEMMRLLVNSNQEVKIDVKPAFKLVQVTNALDGSEDYLVSDKIFGLVGELMTIFQAEEIVKPPPKTMNELINSLIPPNRVKNGKNIVGTELLSEEEMGDEKYEEKEDEKKEEVDTEQLLAALIGNIPVRTTSQESVKKK